jgi:hypothetical protein
VFRGAPEIRQIVTGSIIANSVAARIQHLSSYRPANLPVAFLAGTTGLKTENVV